MRRLAALVFLAMAFVWAVRPVPTCLPGEVLMHPFGAAPVCIPGHR